MKLKSKEVLVIDADPQYQYFVNNILENLGINVIQASHYDEAIQKIQKSVPHLIICETKLPDNKTGLDFQKHIKEDKRFKNIPIFITSTTANKQNIFESLAMGANEYILKPIIAKELIQKVRRCFMDYQSPEIKFINDETGEYLQSFKDMFQDDFSVEVETQINLRALNELSCILQGPIKFPKETVVDLSNDLLNANGGEHLGFRSIEESRIVEAGIFSTRFSLVGVDEKTAQNLRKLRVTRK